MGLIRIDYGSWVLEHLTFVYLFSQRTKNTILNLNCN